jgi:SAM-dependent methyltransferase
LRNDAPEIPVVAVPNCPVCRGAARTHVAAGYDYELETCSNRWDFWRCNRCGGVWLDPRPASTALSVIYPPHYYAYNMSERLSPLVKRGKDWLDRKKFGSIIAFLGRRPSSFLDIGCGDGRYLRMMAADGVMKGRVLGLDLPSPSVDLLRAEGFTVHEGRVEDCRGIAPRSLDLITMFHVIEHVEDPVAVLKRLGEWLSPEGILALETPCLDSLDARLFRSTWWGGYHIPRHWTLFGVSSIRHALSEAGLEVVAIRHQTGHSFWLYSLHHLARYNALWPSPGLARWFDPMRSRVALIAATGFDIVRRTLGARTSAMLVITRHAGRSPSL